MSIKINDVLGVIEKCLVKGFWGEVTISIQDGQIVLIGKKETIKVK